MARSPGDLHGPAARTRCRSRACECPAQRKASPSDRRGSCDVGPEGVSDSQHLGQVGIPLAQGCGDIERGVIDGLVRLAREDHLASEFGIGFRQRARAEHEFPAPLDHEVGIGAQECHAAHGPWPGSPGSRPASRAHRAAGPCRRAPGPPRESRFAPPGPRTMGSHGRCPSQKLGFVASLQHRAG